MIEVELDPATRHTDPHYKRKLREAKRACKEAAGWQCEYIHPNAQRCSARQGQLQRKKGRHGEPDGWKVMSLHGCHVGNKQVPQQQFICFCPKHHAEYDRGIELQEQVSCYRRGYQMTSTDALLTEMQDTGISVWEETDGYHWRVDGTELVGQRTTAVGAVCAAIRQMSCPSWFQHDHASLPGTLPPCTSMWKCRVISAEVSVQTDSTRGRNEVL